MLSLQGGPGESPSSPISISTKSRVMKLGIYPPHRLLNNLNFIFYILYFIFYILYFIFYILYFIFYILYFIFYILYFIFYILYFIFYILYFILYFLFYIFYFIFFIFYFFYIIFFYYFGYITYSSFSIRGNNVSFGLISYNWLQVSLLPSPSLLPFLIYF